jgi:O-antigen ligase
MISTMIQKRRWAALMGLLLFSISILMLAQWMGRHRTLMRGRTNGFPESVADTPGDKPFGISRACVNAPLERYDEPSLVWALDQVVALGADWIRQPFLWSEIQPAPDQWDWTRWDLIVSEARARDLRVVAILVEPPAWAEIPPDPLAFAAFAEAVAERYGETLTYYQIWHNPNLGDHWDGRADPHGYTELLSRASEAIRSVDGDARIVLGSLAPTVERGDRNYAEDLFLTMLYEAGARDYFDVVSVQPYGFETGPNDRRVDPHVLNFSRAVRIREILVDLGDAERAIWASDFGWNSKPDVWPGPASIWGSVDAETQARYTVDALARVDREWPWMGLMCVNNLQPHDRGADSTVPDAESHWGYALIGPDGVPREVYAALRDWYAIDPTAVTGVYQADTDLARFEGAWTLGPQGADIGQTGDRVGLPFLGTGAAIKVRRGPYRAFFFVEVDGEPSPDLPKDRHGRSYVVLYDPLAADAIVPLVEDLPYGEHSVTLIAERGWGQWALADWRIAFQSDSTGYTVGLIGLSLLALVGVGLVIWAGPLSMGRFLARRIRKVWDRFDIVLQALISLVVATVMLFGAWQTLLNETVFRRFGERGHWAALLLSAGLFYFSPWFLVALGAGGLMMLIVFVQPSWGLALTALTAPLYLHPLSLLGKSFSLAELILLPTVAGWGLILFLPSSDGLRPRRFRKLKRELFGPIGAWLLIAVLSTVFAAEHVRVALRELRLVLIEPILFYGILRTLPITRRERWRVIDAWVLSGVAVATIGLVQYFMLGDVITAEGGIRRLRSLYGSPNNVGLYLGRLLPVLVSVALSTGSLTGENRSWRDHLALWGRSTRRVAYALALFPVGLALLLSLSRGALILGVPASLVLMGLLAGKRWRRLALAMVILGAIALVPLLQTPRFAGMFDPTRGTTGFRLALWHSAKGMIKDHPLLGVGLDNFLYAYRTRYVLPTAWEEFNLSHPHNVIMDFGSRLGLLGLGAFVWHQIRFWRRGLRVCALDDPEYRALGLGLLGSMANFWAHGFVDASYFVIDLALVYFLTSAMVDWMIDAELSRTENSDAWDV